MRVLDNYQCEGQMSMFDIYGQDLWFGRTYPEPSAATKEKTSGASLKKQRGSLIKMPLFLCLTSGHQADVSWEKGGRLLGEYTMHSFGEYPNEERESRLSQILEENPHPKYCLSARACQGILNRAERRGKELPPLLKQTLLRQSLSKNVQDVMGGAKGYSYNITEQEHCQPSTTNQSCNSSGDDICGTLDASYYKGCGERQGIEWEVVYCLQGNGIDRADTAGCNGKGWREDEAYTLNTIDRHAVCCSQDAYDKFSENEQSASLKACGGTYGGDRKHW